MVSKYFPPKRNIVLIDGILFSPQAMKRVS